MAGSAAYVVLWKYYDGSGFGVVGVFSDSVEAFATTRLLRAHGSDKAFAVAKMNFDDWDPKTVPQELEWRDTP